MLSLNEKFNYQKATHICNEFVKSKNVFLCCAQVQVANIL